MPTAWDKIYRDSKSTGQPGQGIARAVLPQFKDFINHTRFKLESAFDIGFGNGTYLNFLRLAGFTIAGIDSSEAALALAQDLLGAEANLALVDMYEYRAPINKYDLIVSVNTIHHGRKDQVKRLINEVYAALIPNGWAFITLPTLNSKKIWPMFKGTVICPDGTLMPQQGPERGVPHSVYTKAEVEKLFFNFKSPSIIEDDRQRWIITAQK